jgi:hypothetical protein
VVELLFYVWRLMRRCCDRGCGSNPRKTKQLIQEDYEAMYTGPQLDLQSRYADTLSIFFVVLLYSSGMPILLASLPFCFILTYLLDKYLCKSAGTQSSCEVLQFAAAV